MATTLKPEQIAEMKKQIAADLKKSASDKANLAESLKAAKALDAKTKEMKVLWKTEDE